MIERAMNNVRPPITLTWARNKEMTMLMSSRLSTSLHSRFRMCWPTRGHYAPCKQRPCFWQDNHYWEGCQWCWFEVYPQLVIMQLDFADCGLHGIVRQPYRDPLKSHSFSRMDVSCQATLCTRMQGKSRSLQKAPPSCCRIHRVPL